jgi:UDP-N-acetyl-D-glucosamine dehydrogenase
VLGVSYKPGVGDVRESPALKIIELLLQLGAQVAYHDPYVPALDALQLRSTPLQETVSDADLVLIVTAHPGIDYDTLANDGACVFDLRGVTHPSVDSQVVRL